MSLRTGVLICIFIVSFAIAVPLSSNQPHALSSEWDYDEQGENWNMSACNGREQSPINIVTNKTTCLPSQVLKVRLNSGFFDTEVLDNGHTYQVNGSISKILGTVSSGNLVPFEAAQLHFHAPSEHTIDGKRFDLEVHIVHTVAPDYKFKDSLDRTYAVISILYEADESVDNDPFLSAIESTSIGQDVKLNMKGLLNIGTNPEYYGYPGSLTTPPCSQIVNWFVLAKVQKMTPEQLEYFSQRWSENQKFAGGHGNNRELQPLNNRKISHGNC